jgi:hypothetical protein
MPSENEKLKTSLKEFMDKYHLRTNSWEDNVKIERFREDNQPFAVTEGGIARVYRDKNGKLRKEVFMGGYGYYNEAQYQRYLRQSVGFSPEGGYGRKLWKKRGKAGK